jgi:hypothetical protein
MIPSRVEAASLPDPVRDITSWPDDGNRLSGPTSPSAVSREASPLDLFTYATYTGFVELLFTLGLDRHAEFSD